MNLPKISCCMCTYKRFTVTERAINMFLAQDYKGKKELIIINTDIEHPLIFNHPEVKIWNQDNNYTSVGQIRNDLLGKTTGEYHIVYDSDDLYFPWFISQGVEKVMEGNKIAWKCPMAFYQTRNKIEIVKNTLECCVIVKTDLLREVRFKNESATESLSWYIYLRDNKLIDENANDFKLSYVFRWADDLAGYKMSGNPQSKNNFEDSKKNHFDIATHNLQIKDISEFYKPFEEYFCEWQMKYKQV